MQTEISDVNVSIKSSNKLTMWMILLFVTIALVGLFYVKWDPYYSKAFVAATKHDIGSPIIKVDELATDSIAPSFATAWAYTVAYFKAVWKAAILGIVLGSLVQVLIPRDWLVRVLGSRSFRSTAVASMAALPGMMCTCCAAPIAVGLRKRFASAGAAMAFWLGNPVLNPATMIFMGFVLSWKFVALRAVFGLVMVIGAATIANRLIQEDNVEQEAMIVPEIDAATGGETEGSLLVRWIRSLWSLSLVTVPVYILVVLALGAFHTWLFPAVSMNVGNSILALVLLAISGTLFVIPTAAEIPIVKSMMALGMGVGPAAALMMTLPAISLPSLIMVRKAFPARVLWAVGAFVAAIGITTGLVAIAIL